MTGWKPILHFFLLRVFLCVLCASAFNFNDLPLALNGLEARFPSQARCLFSIPAATTALRQRLERGFLDDFAGEVVGHES
jgi:hypothetical protein